MWVLSSEIVCAAPWWPENSYCGFKISVKWLNIFQKQLGTDIFKQTSLTWEQIVHLLGTVFSCGWIHSVKDSLFNRRSAAQIRGISYIRLWLLVKMISSSSVLVFKRSLLMININRGYRVSPALFFNISTSLAFTDAKSWCTFVFSVMLFQYLFSKMTADLLYINISRITVNTLKWCWMDKICSC